MSWAKHNPEAYSEILKDAVTVKLTAAMNQNGFDDFAAETLEMVIDTLQRQATGGVWRAALGWAHHEIADAGEYRYPSDIG
jgi:hypothetical protein